MARIREDVDVRDDAQALERIIKDFQNKVTELRYDRATLEFDGRHTTVTFTDQVGYNSVTYRVRSTGRVERKMNV